MDFERRTLARQAYEAIRDRILGGRLPAGSKVVVRPLAEELKLSPTPIKAALAALEREGFLVSEPHRGYFVPRVDRRDMQEIYELREVIDGIAARDAATTRAHAELATHLADLLAEQRRIAQRGDLSAYSELDLEFHRAIWESSGNSRLLRVAENLLGQVRLGSGHSAQVPGRVAHSLEEHAEIVATLRAGDRVAAEEAARRHVRRAAEALDAYLAGLEAAQSEQPGR